MARCPKCGTEDEYLILYVKEEDYIDDTFISTCRVKCYECDTEFTVREFFEWDKSVTVDESELQFAFARAPAC